MDKDKENAPPVLSTPNDNRPTTKHNFAEKIEHAAQRMSSQTARVLLKDFSADELQALRETCCNGCKGARWFVESECRFYCTGFIDATLTALGDVIVTEGT